MVISGAYSAEVASGEYRCVGMVYGGNASKLMLTATIAVSGDKYQYEHIAGREVPSGTGTFAYDGQKKMTWTTGPLAGQRDADFEYDAITSSNRIALYIAGAEVQLCPVRR